MVTSFFKISIPFEEFDIQRLAYTEAKLKTLRAEHNHEASFFRNGEFIYAPPKKGVSLTLGELVRLDVKDHHETVESLIRHLVVRAFQDAFPQRIAESFSPLRFPSQKEEHDPMRRLLPRQLQGVIGFPRVIEVYVRPATASPRSRKTGREDPNSVARL